MPQSTKSEKFALATRTRSSGPTRTEKGTKSLRSKRFYPKFKTPCINSIFPSVSHLKVSDEQHESIQAMHNPRSGIFPLPSIVDYIYATSDAAQAKAMKVVAEHGFLEGESGEKTTTRWLRQWSGTSRSNTGALGHARRVLYLCACGYEPTTSTQRSTAASFTGCLAHVEITTWQGGKIVRIRGYQAAGGGRACM
ncbi:hypothetical protein R3P38DRAFT_3048460 [Favolaschia claudopus]|uniref:SnoaL-like domain-containing protein n=1 Tax=Favolaschia claudopus TaxID=2862362 RepID=A0AAW0A5Z8_9AGAR